jgi:hypothetical protein
MAVEPHRLSGVLIAVALAGVLVPSPPRRPPPSLPFKVGGRAADHRNSPLSITEIPQAT